VRVRRFLHILLLIVAGVLLWQAVATWSRPFPATDSTAQDGVEKEKPLPPAQGSADEAGKQFAEVISDKDLFAPSRSRAVKDSTPVAAVAPPSHLKLVGVVLSPEREEAFFADSTQGGKVVRVRKGDTLGSYRLAEVTPSQATLALGDDGEEVSLPLLVLDSGTAAKGPPLMPAVQQQGRPGQARPGAPPARGGGPAAAAVPPAQNESQAIRQNIQQLQQRLRQIRRQAAREGANEAEQPEEEQEQTEGDGEDD